MSIVIENYKTSDGLWAKGGMKNGVEYKTHVFQTFEAMHQRCKVNGSVQKRCATYIGCHCSDLFKNFQSFANWAVNQVGYGLNGYHLDKDLLFENNKLYSEDTCVFIPAALNNFLLFKPRKDSVYPPGICKDKGRFRYRAAIRKDGKTIKLGTFDTVELAYSAYKSVKESEARKWAERLINGEYVVDQRVIDRLLVWKLPSFDEWERKGSDD